MSNLEHLRTSTRVVVPATTRGRQVSRHTERALKSLDEHTLLRSAGVQATSIVQTTKLHEIDFLAREAMSGQAMLRHWAETLSGPDPALAEELHFFANLARMGKGEILADSISTFCNEGRR